MAFHDHRPNRRLGRSERPLVKLTKDLTGFLYKAQRSLTYDTLHLSGREGGILAHILVGFAEDLYQDIGIWKSLEQYNLDFFGTPLPCVLQPDDEMDADPVNLARVQFLLWTLYSEFEPELILAPTHQDLEQLAFMITEFFTERFARPRYDSGVKAFVTTPDQYGWEVKRKLVWLGQHEDYGDASIASSFLIPQDCDQHYLAYLLRRHKGHFYRKRYPSITLVE